MANIIKAISFLAYKKIVLAVALSGACMVSLHAMQDTKIRQKRVTILVSRFISKLSEKKAITRAKRVDQQEQGKLVDEAVAQKPEKAVDNELLDALGNIDAGGRLKGSSLDELIAQDWKNYQIKIKKSEENKNAQEKQKPIIETLDCLMQMKDEDKAAVGQKIGFEKFFQLPKEVQRKIITEFYYADIASYALRHKRELAPLMVAEHGNLTFYTQSTIDWIDNNIKKAKALLPQFIRENGANIKGASGYAFHDRDTSTGMKSRLGIAIPKWIPKEGQIVFHVYIDYTYSIDFNPEQFRRFINAYSLEELEFFVSLARKPRKNKVHEFDLKQKEKSIFDGLDAPMQRRLKGLYPWINFDILPHYAVSKSEDFKKELIPVLGIDDRIELMQNKLATTVVNFGRLLLICPSLVKSLWDEIDNF